MVPLPRQPVKGQTGVQDYDVFAPRKEDFPSATPVRLEALKNSRSMLGGHPNDCGQHLGPGIGIPSGLAWN